MFNFFMIPVIFGLGLLVAHFFYKNRIRTTYDSDGIIFGPIRKK